MKNTKLMHDPRVGGQLLAEICRKIGHRGMSRELYYDYYPPGKRGRYILPYIVTLHIGLDDADRAHSHLTLETDPAREVYGVKLLIHSCGDFNLPAVLGHLHKRLQPTQIEVWKRDQK